MIKARLDKSDEARFRAAIQKLVALSDTPVKDILAQQGRLFVVDAARFTERYGNTAAAGRQHKIDVRKTLNFIYMRPLNVAKMISKAAGEATGRRFSNYIRRRNVASAQALVDKFLGGSGYTIEVGMWDGGALHKSMLTQAGYKRRLVVMDYTNVGKYIRKKVANVGAVKAGWAKAAEQLGGSRGIPAYAKKGHRTRGTGKVEGTGDKCTLTITNHSRYVLENTTAPKLWKLRTKNIEKVVERMVKREAQKITSRI